LFTSGTSTYNDYLTINDRNIHLLFQENKDFLKNKNIILRDYAQTPETAIYIRNKILSCKENVIKCNKYIRENNDVFIHVRLGDIANTNFSYPFEYYDKVLSTLKFDKGYISSDTITHTTCKQLIEKYDLEIFSSDEVNTIQFGSSCKNIVLSLGTFSWYIGAFSFDANVYYPEIKHKWHGDIFVFPEWEKVYC